MATPREVALDHYSDRQSFVDATAQAAGSMWSDVDPRAISKTWAAQIPEMAAVVSGAQLGAARLSDDYLDDILDAEDVDPFSVADVDPNGFRGASDGRGLLSLLANPAIVTLMAIQDGLDVARALFAGRANLDMLVRTQVSDAGRAADQVALTARPAAKGYIRMAVGKTCARCLLLSGKFYLYNAGFQRHPRCLPAGVVVSGPARLAATRRWYEGELCVIGTAGGEELPVTGNHPVLTDRGWMPAQLVQPGDNVVRSVLGEGARPLVVPDEREVPARVEDVWRADGVLPLRRVPSTAEDFHGDGGHGEVDVVLADRLLRHGAKAAIGEPSGERLLGGRVVAAAAFDAQCAPKQEFVGAGYATGGIVRGPGLLLPSFDRHQAGPGPTRCRHVANLDSVFDEAAPNDVAAHAVLQTERVFAGASTVGSGDDVDREHEGVARWDAPAGPLTVQSRAGYAEVGQDLLLRLAGQVELDRVVENRRVQWSGHVYNLTSVEGWYSANGLIVSNCDCIHVPAGDARAARIPGPRQLYDNLSAAERSRAGFSLADQRALREGADFGQVVNAKRGMYTAGGRRFTREGTTKRGLAGSRLKGEPRLTVDQVFRDAGLDRDEALRLLHEQGYLLEAPVRQPARSLPSPAGPGGGGVVRPSTTVRPVLQAAKTNADLDRAFADEARRITGHPMTSVQFGGSVATAREHAEGLLRGLERFPDAALTEVGVGSIKAGSTEYAMTTGSILGSKVEFNPTWAGDRKRYLEALDADVRSGWHPAGTGTPVGIALHEFGHALDLGTLGGARRAEIEELVRLAARERDAAIAVEIADSGMMDAADFVAGPGADGVIARQVSQYATKDADELVAEAFVDVMVNGEAASALSRGIFKLIEDEYWGPGGRPAASFVVSASEPSRSALSKLTIPKLKEIAQQRGIRLPPRARKAEILALLEPPPAGALTRAEVRAAARERNRQIEARGPVEDMLAEVDELLGKSASPAVMLEHLDALSGVPAADLASLRKAAATGDRAKIRAAVTRLGNKHGLKATVPAGKTVKFDPALHELPGGGTVPDGAKVVVIRRGTTLTINGETITFNRAKVALVEPDIGDVLTALTGRGGRRQAQADIRQLVEGGFGGLQTKVTFVDTSPGSKFVRLTGVVLDQRGIEVGKFTRFFDRDPSGKWFAVNSFLEISKSVQGSGFAREFNGRMFDLYRRAGFDRVEVHADIDVGGYTWAAQGFDFRGASSFTAWLTSTEQAIQAARTGVRYQAFRRPDPAQFFTNEELQRELDRFEALLDESTRRHVSAYEFSQVGRKPGKGGKDDMWIGKLIMLGSDWQGVLSL